MRLEWTGFLLLSASLAGLQLMLDRGERAGWFSSAEIVAWAAVAALGLYLFVAHTLTHRGRSSTRASCATATSPSAWA